MNTPGDIMNNIREKFAFILVGDTSPLYMTPHSLITYRLYVCCCKLLKIRLKVYVDYFIAY